MNSIFLFNNYYDGIAYFIDKNSFYNELICRDDCGEILINMFVELNNHQTTNIKIKNILFLLSQNEIFNTLTIPQQNIVNDNLFMSSDNALNPQLLIMDNSDSLCVYTPNNNPVDVIQNDYLTLDEQLDFSSINNNAIEYGIISTLSNPTYKYNCHSYAWYSQNPSTNFYWMDDPSKYYAIDDQSYININNPREGDIICYFSNVEIQTFSGPTFAYIENSHSAIITDCNYAFDINDITTLD